MDMPAVKRFIHMKTIYFLYSRKNSLIIQELLDDQAIYNHLCHWFSDLSTTISINQTLNAAKSKTGKQYTQSSIL